LTELTTQAREMLGWLSYKDELLKEQGDDGSENQYGKAAAIIRALLAEREWRTMDSAPRDGTRVLLWNAYVGQYVSSFCNGEWPYGYDASTGYFGEFYPQPTRWRSLPKPEE